MKYVLYLVSALFVVAGSWLTIGGYHDAMEPGLDSNQLAKLHLLANIGWGVLGASLVIFLVACLMGSIEKRRVMGGTEAVASK